MAFTVEDFRNLVRMLRERPEWREELRDLLLGESVPALLQTMRELASEVRSLAEAQRRTEERLEALAAHVDALAEAQRKTEERLWRLADAYIRLEATLGRLADLLLEKAYTERAGAYFVVLLKRAKAVESVELEEAVEASLDREEVCDLLRADLIVRGRLRDAPGEPEVWLAVEVSATVDGHDVERAARRARLLKKAGFVAIPVAAGEKVGKDAEELAKVEKVALLRDGSVSLWKEALEEWVG